MTNIIKKFIYPKKFIITDKQWDIIDKNDGKVPMKYIIPFGYGIKIPINMYNEAKSKMSENELHEWLTNESRKVYR